MNKFIKVIFILLSALFGTIGIISFFIIIFNISYQFNNSKIIDPELASKFGDFFGGFIGTIFSIMSVLLLIYTILHQNREAQKSTLETNFFRMIDYHNQNVNQLKVSNLDRTRTDDFYEGRRAFVQFKIQIHRLFPIVREVITENNYEFTEEEVADIVYMIFFYGIEGSWISFIQDKLSRYAPIHLELSAKIQTKIDLNPDLKCGRTNQTHLSTYFRNMYNAIKLVDSSKFLNQKEKEDLIKIYRAQLSNPELYILFFNILSRFGKKWIKNKYIIKYNIIKNIPRNYCEDYEPNDYFKMNYEDDDN
ncbi:putative phage abortive infection protein [Chryseobacterium sp. PET-29]|uniref:putative phage abortive infection protein n=1 Tax=Chryseobacterium sp. PET-29 TaxID=2983267 RepID=UPI0021E60C80|nr:putative phage abortive infection protein [Chryseobacterium sp. PET-29]